MEQKGYAGKVSHSGAQEVKAPLPGPGSKGNSIIHRGTDLRQGKGSSKK